MLDSLILRVLCGVVIGVETVTVSVTVVLAMTGFRPGFIGSEYVVISADVVGARGETIYDERQKVTSTTQIHE